MVKTVKLGESANDTEFGARLIGSLQEALAWKRGEIALPVRIVEAMQPSLAPARRRRPAR